MADTALHSMTENTAPAATDEIYLLDDPGGSPADNRISHQNLLKINNLSDDTAPDRTADYLLTYDNSATAAKKVLLGKSAPYFIPLASANTGSDPADATTYYFGDAPSFILNTTLDAYLRVYVPIAGTVTGAEILFVPVGVAGTTETSTLYVRKNNSTDTTLSTTIALNTTYHETVTGLSLSVSAGDYLTGKWTTPTWATNPTDVFVFVKLVIT